MAVQERLGYEVDHGLDPAGDIDTHSTGHVLLMGERDVVYQDPRSDSQYVHEL